MKKHIKTSASLLASLLAFSAVSGRAGFVDRTAELVPDGSALGSADASWGDYNRDGYPDLNTASSLSDFKSWPKRLQKTGLKNSFKS